MLNNKFYLDAENVKKKFIDFYKIYKKRPILKNNNGVKIEHAFYLYLVIKRLKPENIIESGVFAGQSTWLIEKFAPKSKVYCFDINFSNLIYKSKNAQYFEEDLSNYDWSTLKNKNKSLIFFDDHVSFYDRLEFSKKNKFKHIVFDDNYPPKIGDCYSFRKILNEHDQKYYAYEYFNNLFYAKVKYFIKKILGIHKFYGNREVVFEKNKIKIYDPKRFIKFKKKHKISFYKNKYFYFEFPPLIKFDVFKRWKKYKYLKTKDFANFKVKSPLFKENYVRKIVNNEDFNEFSEQYNFFCYYRIKK